MIFIMSAKDSDESGDMSHAVGRFIGQVFVPGFDKLPEEEQESYAEGIDFFVRKTAHAMEYTVLGIFAVLCLYYHGLRHFAVFGFILGALYSVTDEIHQTFVPGRSGQLTDVLLDSSGVLLGTIICYIVIKISINKRNKRATS